ncbi:MAG: 4Fe-4S binding protein [Bacteroidales bacterium]|nr:4Fe-4S binding protein [Bacteroidales bacterium]
MGNRYKTTGKVFRSILVTLPMFLIILLFTTHGNLAFGSGADALAWAVSAAFFTLIFYLMLYKGQTDKYRAIAFGVSAVLFVVGFMNNLIEIRGSISYDAGNIYSCDIPFCHIVSTMVIIPAAVKQTIIFGGNLQGGFASIAEMLVIVAVAALLLGRAFCSWGCFYGGWDDMTSRIRKRPIIRRINTSFKYFSFAMLILMALWSAESLIPQYCNWLCPFKAVTEGERIVDGLTLAKNIIFYTLFIGLVVVLPILTKKRIQCATFCPMGALLSLFNKINIFVVSPDREKCTGCNKCVAKCPLMAMRKNHVPSMTCAKCGRCVDSCPTEAMNFRIRGTSAKVSASTARTIFLYLAFSFMVIFLGSCTQSGLAVIFKLIF